MMFVDDGKCHEQLPRPRFRTVQECNQLVIPQASPMAVYVLHGSERDEGIKTVENLFTQVGVQK